MYYFYLDPHYSNFFRSHINVEYCTFISIKYIFKYLHKCCDGAFRHIKKVSDFDVTKIVDKIQNYIAGRYVSPMEAAWRLQSFLLIGKLLLHYS